jgi:hypothetical protein
MSKEKKKGIEEIYCQTRRPRPDKIVKVKKVWKIALKL